MHNKAGQTKFKIQVTIERMEIYVNSSLYWINTDMKRNPKKQNTGHYFKKSIM